MSQFGDLIETPHVKVFFGNKNSSLENLKSEFSNQTFLKVKQTHSDKVVEASSIGSQASGNFLEADAHYTQKRNSALLISTADCLPVMVYVPESQLVLGIHAGWRGIESNIIGKSLSHLKKLGHKIMDAQVWIGPHIGFKSFEVGLDVADRLIKSYQSLPQVLHGEISQPQPDPQKKRINLHLVAILQLVSAGIYEQNIQSLLIDTFTSADHESYRRDGTKAHRQLSFICLK